MLLISSTQLALDGCLSDNFDIILNSDCTLFQSNFKPGKTYTISATQDSTGGRVLNWPTSWKNMSSISSEPGETSRQQVHVHSDGTVAALGPLTSY